MRRALGTIAAALAASALLAGCAEQSEDAATATTDAAGEQTVHETELSTPEGDATQDVGNGGANTASLTVDGQDKSMANGRVSCEEANGTTTIRVVDTARPEEGIGVLLKQGELSTFSATLDGTSLTVFPGNTGEATLKVDGKSYEISGIAVAADIANPAAEPESLEFSFSVTCP